MKPVGIARSYSALCCFSGLCQHRQQLDELRKSFIGMLSVVKRTSRPAGCKQSGHLFFVSKLDPKAAAEVASGADISSELKGTHIGRRETLGLPSCTHPH